MHINITVDVVDALTLNVNISLDRRCIKCVGVDLSRTLVSPNPSSPKVRKLTTVAYRLFVCAGREEEEDGERGRVDSNATTSLRRNVRDGFSS